MILSKQLLVLILSSASIVSFEVPKAFALCMQEPGNLLVYCRGGGYPGYHLPEWYNQPLGVLYEMIGLGIFIGLLLTLLFLLKYKKSRT